VIKLADLERGARELSAAIPEAWLKQALANTDAVPLGDGSVAVELLKTGREVIVRGHARASVSVPCVVTLEPLRFELEPEVFLRLLPAPESAHARRRSASSGKEKPAGLGKEKHAPPAPTEKSKRKRRRDQDDPELSLEQAAEDVYHGDEIVLDDFLREFIVLEIPPYPRRSDLPSAEERLSSRPLAESPQEKPIDPRLLPLLDLRARLRE
jgi:uncharacterized metal-binding protein YceD (DUF177 family)